MSVGQADVSVTEFLSQLRERGIRLRTDEAGQQIGFDAPRGAMTSELLTVLKARKVEILAALRANTASVIPREISRVPRVGPLPVSMAQQRLWFLYHLDNKGPTYNIPKALRFCGPLDAIALEKSLHEIMRRHESLRTSYETHRGEPVQIVHPPGPEFARPLRVDAVGSEEEARRLAAQEAQTPFDLALPPLIRPRLLRIASDDHVLLLTMHHIVSDGRSIEVLCEELAALYGSFARGITPRLPELPIQYADYAVFQRTWLKSGAMDDQVAYWTRQLDDAPPRLELPTDRPRPLMQTFKGGMEYFEISPEVTAGLRSLARETGASLFMTVSAALGILLSRYSGQDEVCIGCPVENRAFPETENLIGVFINTLVLRMNFEGNPTFRETLERVRSTALDAYSHQDVPFEKLVEALNPDRNLGASPLFQVAVSWLSGERGLPSIEGLAVEPFPFDFVSVKFDLNLEVYESREKLGVAWFFNSALFDRSTVQRMVRHLSNLLEGIAKDSARTLSALPLMDGTETQRLVADWNATSAAYPRDRSVVELFEEQAVRTPTAAAVVCEGDALTYADLNARANRLARHLGQLGVGPGKLVGLLMDQSSETIVAILGTLKAGGAYVPIDARYPAARIAYLLEDSRVEVLLTRGPLPKSAAGCEEFRGRVVDLLDSALASSDNSNLPERCGPTDAAYVIYTSGSTGRPKGVVVEHRGLTNYIWWANKVYCRGDVCDFPLFTSLSFDLTVTSIYVPLISGGRIVVYREDETSRVPAVFRVMRDREVDIVKLTPAHLSMIRDMDMEGARVKRMILGGEDLKTELCRSITDAFRGNIEIFNEYGPTETVVGCMIHRYDPETDRGTSVPIGVPAENVQIYLLDRNGALVPTGAVGEMFIAGDGVAREYLNRPDLTTERFVPDPFRPGSRLYKTGDLARWRSDGVMEYLGRVDHQVKIRGHRIELDEIAAEFASHEAVRECVVQVVNRDEIVRASTAGEVEFCSRCGLPANYPGTVFDADGVCNMCLAYDRYKDKVRDYFRPFEELEAIFREGRESRKGSYDALVLFSGGKDSSYMLGRLVEMGLSVLAYTLDPGYLSEQARGNIKRVVEALGVDHVFGTTSHMGTIFVDSLKRHGNVCNGCFKALYTLSMNLAKEKGIPFVVTGLSRGQFFETRLSKFYNSRSFDVAEIDRATLEARKIYHRLDDVISRTLPVEIFRDDRIFEEVRIVDFYRYCDVDLDDLYAWIEQKIPWVRPSDTGRSTNCLINDLGIYHHTKSRGYHNYALPYSWDVRMGHKKREAALHELHDDLDLDAIRKMMREIGFEEEAERKSSEKCLVAYYVSRGDVSEETLRAYLSSRLPEAMIPSFFVPLAALPLTSNGKIDRKALPMPEAVRPRAEGFVAPRNPVEQQIAKIWSTVLGFDGIGVHDNFFTLGGHSLLATQVVARVAEEVHVELPLGILFDKPTIAELAEAVSGASADAESDDGLDAIFAEVEAMTDEEAARMLESGPR
jgi:amino acid adenylation domain-containing protein